ncbi:MAG TPA: acyl-CoA dehydrogenase family protein [Pseudomonadales bacterium]|jgi:alkylation response protein AidB-like acyl-CoA dehydrogenase|nr:acyl-CoA dehydrogenase [Gammaproteobacteria bacterium]MDP6025739.1 acyl-CoA dehydrogenase family protein [Pseudomonadales bacterium]MDP6314854.1 acyl-CoA dehydrogenase family protein [Pseudomonadales bacterium]MDP7313744.1 acyl-CoA dehydrogenase family protein [Pseudomonadales bacterium]HJL61712.1 acyl-CoA dehydrogenase family protein [Pseudomonadales bacterium]|tara:strand:+ start:10410 stop:11585 length:1176 start_codon:yes stop_codon:yes gene_type:complete
MSLDSFRQETRAWLEENCPAGARGPGEVSNGSTKIEITDPDTRLWLERMVEKGWTVANWPKQYGGGGLSTAEYVVLIEEMRRIRARAALSSFGTSMIGPTLLEYGTEEQKQRHLPRIARAEVEWCQGYSEPGSGSDLASLQTQAVLEGDNYVINGQKIWTSGAHNADWMFILVRTDKEAPKHEGISFMLLPMDQEGVTVKPIKLLSGESPFNETFFDDALAARDDLVGELNRGWTVGKRLLQHERSGMESLVSGSASAKTSSLADVAKTFLGEVNGKIANPITRDEILNYEMDSVALHLTQRRVVEESQDGATPGPATSIFKVVSTELEQDHSDLLTRLHGSRAFGVDNNFTVPEIEMTKQFFFSRAASIYSGSNEIQRNIIAKRVLGLPD